MPRPGRRLLAIAVLSLLAVSACTIDRTYLPALRADPMATYEPPGTELVEAEYRPRGADSLTGGSALVQRVFHIVDQDTAEAVVQETVDEAMAEGWTFNSQGGGCKKLEPGLATLSATLEDDDATADPNDVQLQVLLLYREAGSDSCD